MATLSVIRRFVRRHIHGSTCVTGPSFSTDDDFQQAVRRLKRNGPIHNKKNKLKLVSESPEVNNKPLKQEGSIRQLRRSKQVQNIISEELSKSENGSLIEITEVAPSRDLKRIVIWWQLFSPTDGPSTSTIGIKSAWLRPAQLTSKETEISSWLDNNASRYRYTVQLKLQAKYASELVFKCDKSQENSAAFESIFARIPNIAQE